MCRPQFPFLPDPQQRTEAAEVEGKENQRDSAPDPKGQLFLPYPKTRRDHTEWKYRTNVFIFLVFFDVWLKCAER